MGHMMSCCIIAAYTKNYITGSGPHLRQKPGLVFKYHEKYSAIFSYCERNYRTMRSRINPGEAARGRWVSINMLSFQLGQYLKTM